VIVDGVQKVQPGQKVKPTRVMSDPATRGSDPT
jgi:hypothetical protein